jgi:hypothetical protein
LQIGGSTYPINPTTELTSRSDPSCTCEFLSWGSWRSTASDPRDNGKTYTALGTYVAGTLTTAIQMPQTGSATYNGFMAGFVNNRSDLVMGSYQNVWNFQNRTGYFTGNFDRQGYSGPTGTTGGPGSTTFTGTFTGGNRSGALNGAFFSSPTDAAAYQAGAFSIRGSGYRAGGSFAGQRQR